MIAPLDCPRSGCKSFEVTVYNQMVRESLKENRPHLLFDDRWADPNRRVVQAHDAEEARLLAARRYPPDQGFVIAGIAAMN